MIYNNETLIHHCSDNDIKLLDDYTDVKINREYYITPFNILNADLHYKKIDLNKYIFCNIKILHYAKTFYEKKKLWMRCESNVSRN